MRRHNAGFVRKCIDGLAVLAYLGFFAIAAKSVARTLMDGAVFMTQVHEVLLSPIFLASGAYLGPYVFCLLIQQLLGKRGLQ
ncbi:transposase [Paenibacillus montanisoli]|uniref:Transposase n=1 Tax=Paenibacillus montanisoli TaxID=2081970 RepID=A0A328U931_9BACL|nr:transposase [Paenibacillus montanisoli]